MTIDAFLETLGCIILAGVVAALLAGLLVPRHAQSGAQVVDSLGVDHLPHLDPQPVDVPVDRTGAATPAWDCRERGHVVCMGSAYCLECKALIG